MALPRRRAGAWTMVRVSSSYPRRPVRCAGRTEEMLRQIGISVTSRTGALLAFAALLSAPLRSTDHSAVPSAAPRLPRIFQDGMVLQRDAPIPIWGWATPQSTITVTLAGRTERGVADIAGAWHMQVPALPAGGPHVLTVSSDGATL